MGIGDIANTGMQAALSNMEVTSNNIANANTLGFKKSYISFADLYPSANGAAGNQIGLGVEIENIGQDFTNGGYAQGVGPLDLAIQNSGFFVLSNPVTGQLSYTRAGRFTQSPDGFIVYGNQHLQGYQAVNGVIPPGASVGDISFSTSGIPAQASSNVNLQLNLNSVVSPPATSTFSPTDPTSYNYPATSTVYDSLGNQHQVQSYYVNSAPNTWSVYTYVDGNSAGSPTTLNFSTSGQLPNPTVLSGLSFNPGTGATNPQNFTITLTGTTQVAGSNAVNLNQANGYQAGTFSNLSVDGNGMVSCQYTNGQNVVVGQVALANFPSEGGLAEIGNQQWVATSESGNAIFNQSASTSNIRPNFVENSNVDLTTEMVNLINQQQNFQANSQVEQTYSEVMKTVIQL